MRRAKLGRALTLAGLAAFALAGMACATSEPQRPAAMSPLASLVIAQVAPAPQPPPIGWADLERAKALLNQARAQLQPQQYELLQRELAQAETAWQRFSTAARASGHAAEVARGTQAVSGAQRAARIATKVGPLLVALALLWPSRTAGPEMDPPPWLAARLELEAKLERVAAASRQVGEQIEAAGRKKPISLPDETTCIWVGVGGGGKPVICRYNCDGVEDTIEVTLPDSMVQCPGETSNPLKWKEIKRYPQRL